MPNITYGRWNPTEVMERRLDSDWPSATPYATNLVIPTSITSTGTGNSSTINTNGSVTFSSCTTLSLNGVFSADYENYMIYIRHSNATTNEYIRLRWRVGGTDSSTANYTYQSYDVKSTTRTGTRSSAQTSHAAFSTSNSQRSGYIGYVFVPFLTRETAMLSLGMYAATDASIEDLGGTQGSSTSYDGFTLSVGSTISGLISVYGLGI